MFAGILDAVHLIILYRVRILSSSLFIGKMKTFLND